MFGRRKFAAIVAEFFGTFILASAVLALATRTSFPFFAAIAAGVVLGVMIMVFAKVSGSHINPAVTIGLWSLRKVQTTQAVVYVAAQAFGGLCALYVSQWMLDEKLPYVAEYGVDRSALVAELVGTLIFTFGLAAAIYKGFEGGKLAFTAGASLTIGILVASLGSNGILNPAVAIGLNSFSWAYAVGPILGGIIGMNIYKGLFAPLDTESEKPSKATKAKKKK